MAISLRFHSPYLSTHSHDPLPLILSTLKSAQQTVDFCLSELTVEAVVAEAASLRDQGVQVRWLVEAGFGSEKLLSKYGFKRFLDWRGYLVQGRAAHQNFILIDGHRVLTGGMALTQDSLYLQEQLTLQVDSREIGGAFWQAMESYWSEARGEELLQQFLQPVESVTVGPDQIVSAYFTPYDGGILRENFMAIIQQAEQSLHFALPSFADLQVVEALEERARAGVHVSGVVDFRNLNARHLSQAPALKNAYLRGKIRAMRGLGQGGIGIFNDGLRFSAAAVDGRWTFLSGVEFGPTHVPGFQAENALVIDSGPISRQCAGTIEELRGLAKAGGHTMEGSRSFLTYQSERAQASRSQPTRRKAA